MPTGADYGKNTNPSNHTVGHFSRMGPSQSAMANFQYPFMFRDVVFWFDDFQQAATLTDWYTLGTDACATAFVPAAGLGGTIAGATSAGAGKFLAILTSADWEGDKNAGQEMRWQVDDNDNICWEQGFTDPLSDNTLGGLNDIDTPSVTNGATDIALIALQADATLTTAAFVTDGVTACMNTTKTDLGSYVGTNSAYHTTRIQLEGNSASGYVFDAAGTLQQNAQHGSLTACSIEGGTDLTARLVVGALACSDIVPTADYWAIWQCRT